MEMLDWVPLVAIIVRSGDKLDRSFRRGHCFDEHSEDRPSNDGGYAAGPLQVVWCWFDERRQIRLLLLVQVCIKNMIH